MPPTRHRPSTASPGGAIGVDLGGSKVLVGAVDEQGGIGDERKAPTLELASAEAVCDTIAELVGEVAEANPGLSRVGVGAPCTIDRASGVSVSSVHLPLVDFPLRDALAERVGMPVALDNDGNCAMLAEHRLGAARGASDAVMLTLGTGIGGGILIGGEIYRGSHGSAAELGHMVVAADGPVCEGRCGAEGCIESLASGNALGREGLAAAERTPTSALGAAVSDGSYRGGETVVACAREGDPTALGVLAEAGRYLGIALAGIANALDPGLIVIGGGAAGAGDLLLDPARSELAARALRPMNAVPVVEAQLGPEAGMVGAALLAVDEPAG